MHTESFRKCGCVVLVLLLTLLLLPLLTTPASAQTVSPEEFLKSSQAIEGDGVHHLGFQLAPQADYPAAPAAPLRYGAVLGASADLSSQFPPIGNQGSQGSCVAWATSYYYKSWVEKQEHTSWSFTNTQYRFSPSFVYNQINGGSDNGSSFPDAFSLLQNKGDIDIAEFPYNSSNWTTQPSAAQLEAAKPYSIPNTWYSFWNQYSNGPFASPNSIDNAKAWIAAGKPLVMGLPIYNDFPGFGGTPNKAYYDYNGSSTMSGGHGVCIVGYDDNINPGGADADHRGGFKMVNSWGASWNGNGYIWLSYDFARRYVWEAWCMGDNSPDSPSISSLSSGNGEAGASININGANFGTLRRSAKVTFNGTQAASASFTNARVTATVPAGATSGPVLVYDWEGTPSNAVNFTVGAPPVPAPSVSSVSPADSLGATAVSLQVMGANFMSGCQVKLELSGMSIEATGEALAGTGQVSCSVDLTGAENGNWDVVVTNPDAQTGRRAACFTISPPAPEGSDTFEPNDTTVQAYPITAGSAYQSYMWSADDLDYFSLAVPSGCTNITAKLTGIAAGCDYDLTAYSPAGVGTASTNAGSSDEQVSLGSPAAGTYYLKVEAWSSCSTSEPYSISYTVTIPAVYTGMTPTGGNVRTVVTINGRGFGTTRGTTYVKVGSTAVVSTDYVSWSNTRIQFKVPGTCYGKNYVTIMKSGKQTNCSYFYVRPRVASFSPSVGYRNGGITINGTGFGRYNSSYCWIYFNSVKVTTFTSWSNTKIVVKIPYSVSGSVAVKVRSLGGTSDAKYLKVY